MLDNKVTYPIQQTEGILIVATQYYKVQNMQHILRLKMYPKEIDLFPSTQLKTDVLLYSM